MALTSVIAKRSAVPDSQQESMFQLHCRYFCNGSREVFFKDMHEKEWIVILRDQEDIVGFSTLQIIRLPIDGTDRIFLFSGDTIVDRTHWRDSTLAGCFGHFMLRLMKEYKDLPRYWFLISKGYRTYRFLPVYFKEFHPAYHRPMPPDYARLVKAVATFKFHDAFDPASGLIQLGGQRDRLRPEMCGIPESRRNDPHVRFFLDKNPTYFLGDELACIADISRENLNKYAWRVIENTTVIWNE